MKPDLVSVIIPTKDRPVRVARAIQSVLNQTYVNLEVIVVDDGSKELLKPHYGDSRLKIIRNERPIGGAGARNTGMRVASGAYISLLDDDDYYFPEKIEKQLRFLHQNPDVDMVFSKILMVNENTGFYTKPYGDDYTYEAVDNLHRFNMIHNNATLFKREVATRIAFDESLERYQDTQFNIAVSLNYKVAFLPEEVAVWNVDKSDNRIDPTMSLENSEKEFVNFQRLGKIFSDAIEHDEELKKAYYHRLLIMARCANKTAEAREILHQMESLSERVFYVLFSLAWSFSPWMLNIWRRKYKRYDIADDPRLHFA